MSCQKSKIEILVVKHKPAYTPDNRLLKPIQVNAAKVALKLPSVAYYDNTGDNISSKNDSYCELTAIYWAWKNLDADYYGLWHYRRYFSFSDEQDADPCASKAYSNIHSAIHGIGLDADKMQNTITKYDIIIPRQESLYDYGFYGTIHEQYKENHYIGDLDDCLDYVSEHYPEIAKFNNALESSKGYFCNMFIMRKKLYHDYCKFLFDVLGHFDRTHDTSGYNIQQRRVNGFIAERLTNIYIHYLKSFDEYKIKELQTAFFKNTDPLPVVSPLKDKNNIAIALTANDAYAPYLSTLIHSIAAHASPKYHYDINIFSQNLSPANTLLLQNEFTRRKNISIRAHNMRGYADQYEKLLEKWQISVETYFRLFIPDIMPEYHKVLYLDGDMIIKRDVAELYSHGIKGKLLAAVRDIDMAGVYNSNNINSENTIDPKRQDYLRNKLKLKSPQEYFQAGVLLFNLDEIRKTFTTSELIGFAARGWEFQDQDVLNFFAQGKVEFLDFKWNVQYDWESWRIEHVISKAPYEEYVKYMDSRKDPYIIHYSGSIKPWQRANCDFATDFWLTARTSVFYEQILSTMCSWISGTATHEAGDQHRSHQRLRKFVDTIAPHGSLRRKPITFTKHALKKTFAR